MNCPKCGFEQEERLDCRKCGVVFNKYLAMQAESSGPLPPQVPQAENGSSTIEILELRQSVRDLGRRFSEVEFERVERGQLRGEVKTLDKKYQASFDQFSRRLEDLEKLLSTPQAPPPVPDGERLSEVQREILEANVDPISKRLAETEERLQLWASEVASLREIMAGETARQAETSTNLASRLDGIEQKLKRWEEDFVPPRDSVTTEILGRFEARLTDLESRSGLLVAAKPGEEADAAYQEIQTRLRTLADEIAGLKSSTDKLPSLQGDITEVRAESAKIWAQVQGLESNLNRLHAPAAEASPQERLELDIRSIRDSLQEIREFITRATAKA